MNHRSKAMMVAMELVLPQRSRVQLSGVAKNVNIVVVKINPIDDYIAPSRYIEACAIVARDIESKGLQGKAVICSTLNGEHSRS
jgi:hypothetical protein